jgi:potassium channel subfamily K
MTHKAPFRLALPSCIFGWLVSCLLLSISIGRMTTSYICLTGSSTTVHSQAYYYGIFSLALLALGSLALSVTFMGAWLGHYEPKPKLTAPQRTLILQIIALSAYHLLGSLAFSHIESWPFLDSFYWVDLTLLTIGLGNSFVPQTRLGRGLLLPFAITGIGLVGLVVGSTHSLAFKRARMRLRPALIRGRVEKVLRSLEEGKTIIRLGIFRWIDLGKTPLTSGSTGEKEFLVMRCLIDVAGFDARVIALVLSAAAFVSLWLGGAAIFMAAEGWSYFDAWYFSYVVYMTIGYGDFAPATELGRAFFVGWTMLAVPLLTIAISHAADVLVVGFRKVARQLGKP